MKNSYTLFGTFLDGKDGVITQMPSCHLESEIEYCDDYLAEHNIFDFQGMKRRINLSDILKLEKDLEFDLILLKLKQCDEIFLVIDKFPEAPSIIIVDFFMKRLIQAYWEIKKTACNAKVNLAANSEIMSKIKPLLRDRIALMKEETGKT